MKTRRSFSLCANSGRAHHVEQAVAEDLLDGGPVVVVEEADDPLADAQRRAGVRRGRLQRTSAAVAISEAVASWTSSFRIAATTVRSAWSSGVVEGDERLLDRALAEDDDEARHAVVDRDEVDAADAGRGGLGGRREAGGVGQRGDRRGGEAEPVLARELHLAELVADHQLLDLGQRRVSMIDSTYQR